MWAIGAGMSTASVGPSPCTRAINEAFQLNPRWVWSTAFGTPVEPDVNRTRATSEGRLATAPAGTGAPPTASASAAGSENAAGSSSRTRAGSIWPRAAATSAAPKVCRTRCGHGADAPAGPGQDGGRQAVGHLPGHRFTAADAPGPQPAGDRGHQGVDLRGREPRGTVDDLAGVGREQGVQGGDVPGPPGLPVATGLFGHPGRSEAGRHGRAPYPGPGIVTPMSGSWREPAWISR